MDNGKFFLQLLKIMILCFITSSCSDEPNFIYTEKTDSPIIGIWEVVNVSKEPFKHPSYCHKLIKGAKFIFDYDCRMYVYNSNNQKPCNNKQHYFYRDSIIEMSEGDMLFNYEIDYLSNDTMNIKYLESLTLIRIKD